MRHYKRSSGAPSKSTGYSAHIPTSMTLAQMTSLPCAPHRRTLTRRRSASAASKKSPASQLLAAMALLAVAGTSSVYAATDLWVGNTDVNFGTTSNWTGSVAPGGNTPTFGVAGSSGTTLNNDIVGASFTGITFNSGASAFTIGGNSFTLTGNITNSSSSLQTISNNITLTGNRTLAGGTGGLTLGGTTTHTQTSASAGLVITGTVNSSGTFTEDGAAVSNAGYISIGGNNTLNVTAGTFSFLGTTNATKPLSVVGQNAAGTSNLNVSGGNLVIGANTGFALANASTGTGVLTITSGTATINRGTTATTTNTVDARMIMMGRAPTSDGGNTGIINLNGGTLATDRQFVRNGSSGGTAGTANFVFGGGTLKALGTQTDWLQSTTATSEGQNQGASGGTINTNALALTSVTTTAVSTIDANSFSVAINSAISGAGGFNINSNTGTGTVTFGGANTYNGGTTVTSGTLATSSTGGTFGAGNVSVVSGAALTFGNNASIGDLSTLTFSKSSTASSINLNFSGAEAVGFLFDSVSSTYLADGTYTAGDLNTLLASMGGNAVFTGTGSLIVSAIPEPSTYAALAGVLALGAVIIRRRNRQA